MADETTTSNSHDSQPKERLIRVFVSSTFRDMQAEREVLVKHVFPQLRKLCDERGVVFTDVDLRWGITEEQSAEAKVLPICLAEIERCRPFFIGLLGERYGWVPESIPQELIELQPWLAEHKEKSVTELEIIHGVLSNPAMADRARFYFRDPEYVKKVGANLRSDYIEEDPVARQKLATLKEQIQASDIQWHDNYPDPQTLGAWILDDLTKLIDKEFPPGSKPTELQRQAAEHESFARSRRGVYIGRQSYFDTLDAHAATDGPPLVVLGESGSGKSALLANWAERYRQSHRDGQILLHFIGASADSADWAAMLRRTLGEFNERFGIEVEIPDKPDELRATFANALHMTAARGRLVLVIDALNQLEDRDGAPDLVWLPPVIPENIRLILSTLPGRPLDDLEKRDWQVLQIESLTADERRQLICDYLMQFTKNLSDERIARIAASEQAANPLFLRALLEELRVFGAHERLDERIDYYLDVQTVDDLYERILQRWEEDYEGDRRGFVREAMSLLWAARRGLSETELLELLGTEREPLPQAHWSPLFLAAEQSLTSRGGLLNFFHNYLRQAVQDRYISSETDQRDAHLRLANYFARHTEWTHRKLDELPWQLAEAHERQQLHDVLTEEACFLGLRERNEYELLGYWRQLKPEFDLANSYTEAFARWEQLAGENWPLSLIANSLGAFLHLAACHSAAEPLFRRALAIDEGSLRADHPNVATVLSNLALLYHDTNRLAEAEPLIRRALAINEVSYGPTHPAVALVLNNLVAVLQATNRLAEAEPLMRRALAIDELFYGSDHPDVARDLNNLALLLQAMNRLEEAEPLYGRALAIEQVSYGPEHPKVAKRLSNLATLLEATNRFTEAESLKRRALAIDELFYGSDHPDVARDLNNLALLLQATNRLEEAESLLRRVVNIFDENDPEKQPNYSGALNNLAHVLQETNRLSEAEPLMRRALAIDEVSYGPDHPNVANRLNNLAKLLQATNRLAEAEPLGRRVVEILLRFTRSTGHPHSYLKGVLGNYSRLLHAMGRSEVEVQQELTALLSKYGVSLE